MFIKSIPDDTLLPHRENILAIHKSNPFLRKLDRLDPIYAGGYVMALFAAPRWKGRPNRLSIGYYNDIDVYPRDQKHLIRLKDWLNIALLMNPGNYVFRTEMASTYTFQTPQGQVQIQLITGLKAGKPEEIIGNFDFVNCAFAFTPRDEAIYFHRDFITYHNAKELQILKPWMLDEATPDNTLLLTQLLRFNKYCKRWKYTLSRDALNKLVEIYRKWPHLRVKAGQKYQDGSGGQESTVTKDQYVWKILADTMTSSPYWKPEMDQHGILIPKPKSIDNYHPKRRSYSSSFWREIDYN